MPHWSRHVPFYWIGRRMYRKIRRIRNRVGGPAELRRRLATAPSKRIVIGAATHFDTDWIPTDQEVLDLLKPDDWSRYLAPDSVDAILAEHVWEHLTLAEGLFAARTCFTYLKPGGYLRLAVPDGLHPDPEYIGWIRVGGASPGQHTNDHKVLFTYASLRDLLSRAGFRVVLYEYFDDAHTFQFHEWSREGGTIRRSSRYDPRNHDGQLRFTSIVADAIKPLGRTSSINPAPLATLHQD